MSNAYDIAYLAGFGDGSKSVASLTLRLVGSYMVIGLLLIVIVYLMEV